MTSARPSFIVFNSPPRLSVLLDHQTWLDNEFTWSSTSSELVSATDTLRDEPSSSWPSVSSILARDITESQFQDAISLMPATEEVSAVEAPLPTSAEPPRASWEGPPVLTPPVPTPTADKPREHLGRGVYANNVFGDADESSYAVYKDDSRWATERATPADEVTVEDSFEAGTPWQGRSLAGSSIAKTSC